MLLIQEGATRPPQYLQKRYLKCKVAIFRSKYTKTHLHISDKKRKSHFASFQTVSKEPKKQRIT